MTVKRKLKIGVVIDQLLPGGVQIAAIEEVKNLIRLGIKAELLILMRKKYSFQFQHLVKDVPYKYLSDSYPWPFKSTIKFPIFAFFSTLHLLSPFLAPKVIREGTYDLLISHGTTTCFTTLTLWRRRKIPYMAIVHDPITFILKKVYSGTFLRFLFSIFIPLSSFLEKMFVRESLTTVIDSAVHQKFIQKNYHTQPIVLSLGCQIIDRIPPKRGSSILALSRWQKEKNPSLLLKILKEIPRSNLIIAGAWTNQVDLENFKKDARRLGVSGRIKILPQFESVSLPTLFRKARVWVHPNFEAFGMGGLEAASNGVPIVIPAGSGITDLFRNKVDGFFPRKVTLSEYKKCVKKLLDDERLAYKMGKNAWAQVKEEYSWQAHTKKLLTLAKFGLQNLCLPKITAIEIGHAGRTGLSGGDTILEEMAERMPKEFKIEVITSPFGSRHWRQARLKVDLKILNPNPFEENPGPVSVFLSYFSRIIQTSTVLLKENKSLRILYSSTNILPDVLPAFVAKLRNPKTVWIARIHHLIPQPHKREGRLIVNLVSYLMQYLALFCVKTRADLAIALNETLLNHLLKIGFPQNKLRVLGAGINFKEITSYKPKEIEAVDGLYLGRLHVVKGVFDALDIWSQVTKEEPGAKLAIIGAGPSFIREALALEIKRRHLLKNVKILGFLPKNRVYDYLKSAKLFLFTDHEAGWGLAIGEGMAASLPVVGYNIPGVFGDVYKKGALTVPLGETQLFAKEVVRLLKDQEQRTKLSKLAQDQARSLSWEKTTQKFLNLLKPYLKV